MMGKADRPFYRPDQFAQSREPFSEATTALRTTEGVMAVVDGVEGCAMQTEIVLRQALAKRVKPCLFVNEVDRGILELQMEAEDN